MEHHYLVRTTVDAQNGVGTTVKGFDLIIDAAVEILMRAELDAKISPGVNPFNAFAIENRLDEEPRSRKSVLLI